MRFSVDSEMSFKRTCGKQPIHLSSLLQPSGNDAGEGSSDRQKAAIYCQPSEDEDMTVADAANVRTQTTANLLGAEFNRPYIRGCQRSVAEKNAALVEDYLRRQNFNPVFEDGVTFPKAHDVLAAATCNNVLAMAQNPEFCAMDNIGSAEINLHSDHSGEPNRLKNELQCDYKHAQDVQASFDGVDQPGFGVTVPETGDVSTLKKNYKKLLERHQQFIVSNAQLLETNEELMNHVAQIEKELNNAKADIQLLEEEKMHLTYEITSLQRTLSILKNQMSMISSEPSQPSQNVHSDDKRSSSEEWTSSLKEELRQTILLAMTQQQELHGLYRVIKQQNESIRQLSRPTSSAGYLRKTLPVPLQESRVSPKESELLYKPEGSSVPTVDKLTSEQKTHNLPTAGKNLGGTTIPFKDSLRKMFGARIGGIISENRDIVTTTNTVTKTPLASNDERKQTFPRQSQPMASGRVDETLVKGLPALSPTKKPECSYAVGTGASNFDFEHSSFVFVDPSQTETRICPLCSAEFSSDLTTMDQFVEHVSKCNPPEETSQCPVCLVKFDKKFTNREIEMHVNEHFDEDRFLCLSPTDINRPK